MSYRLTWHLARELTLDAAQSARSSRSSTKTMAPVQIKRLLDSRNDREVLDGLRRVIGVRSSCGLCIRVFSMPSSHATHHGRTWLTEETTCR